MTIAEALVQTAIAEFDAQLLLAHVLDKDRSYLIGFAEQALSSDQQQQFQQLVKRREAGEPIAYLVGHKEFWSLDLHITPAVLIPREDTELLVELILRDYGQQAQLRIADLGTGSGAIALALASEKPQWEIVATDNSPEALAVAQNNAKRLGLTQVNFYQGEWCQALPQEKFDVIVSNPPYIHPDDPHLQQGDLRYEPLSALQAMQQGLNDLQKIIAQAKNYLVPQGRLYLEHGYDQVDSVCALLAASDYRDIQSERDLAGHWRVSYGCVVQLPDLG